MRTMKTIRFPNKSAAALRRANRKFGEPIERFWKQVQKGSKDECWLWTGYKLNKDGYGGIRANRRTWSAHRYSYFLAHGEFDEALNVCHHCDNPPCVNPHHLFLGTRRDNMIDMVRKGRNAVRRGEANSSCKLKEKTVLEIIKDRESGLSRWELARKYKLPEPTIGGIVTGKSWKHLGYKPKPVPMEQFRGEGNKTAKLTDDIVRAIRAQYATGLFSYAAIAEIYKLGTMTVAHAIKGETWKHVT